MRLYSQHAFGLSKTFTSWDWAVIWGKQVGWVLALFLFLWPASGLLLREGKPEPRRRGEASSAQPPALRRSFHLLFSASLVASTSGFVFLLGRSLGARLATLRVETQLTTAPVYRSLSVTVAAIIWIAVAL